MMRATFSSAHQHVKRQLALQVLQAIGIVWDVKAARISQASEEEIAA